MLEFYKTRDFDQHYPTYKIDKEIGLAEYHSANAAYQSEEKIFNTSATITTFLVAIIGSSFVNKINPFFVELNKLSDEQQFKTFFYALF